MIYIYKKFLCVTILACASVQAASYTPAGRSILTKQILVKPHSMGPSELDKMFKADRHHVKQWFDQHQQILQDQIDSLLPVLYKGTVRPVLAGSYYWKTNHMLSDVDILLVIDDQVSFESMREHLMPLLRTFYAKRYPCVETIVRNPKHDIFVVKLFNFNDAMLQDARIDIGFKSQKEYATMLQREQQALDAALGGSCDKRMAYVRAMMCATYYRDFELKHQMRIVPDGERK